ncbi:MAG: indole-3-glycerol phosphate synthase TrpC [Planctomycetes bacterium]|nr:indole-3-glycerol phosphate synthase TrpC [Planctomycetota bacterium]
MANILDRIVQTKRIELTQAKQRRPLTALQREIEGMARCRNFYRAIISPPLRAVNLIAEVKKASPSAGVICEDFDPVAIAKTYAAAGASALSVLTDGPYFQGRLADLTAVKQAVKLPVLRKDFIIDPYQVYESRAAGADAILLIAACLKVAEIMDLIILASQLTLTSLVEVHGLDELLRLRSITGFPQGGYVLLGINNRDLNTFTVDIGTTTRLAEFVDERCILVSESGIHTHADVQKLVSSGVQSMLVGESLMRSGDIAAKVAELLGPVRPGAGA